MSVVVDGTNGLVFNDASTQTTAASGFGFKNRFINGDMRIDQRNSGNTVAGATGTIFAVDRTLIGVFGGGTGRMSGQRSTTVPSGTPFVNSLVATVTTADASPGSEYGYCIRQQIEGFNIADLRFGTAAASPVTLSFWVRSSIAGTYGVCFQNADVTRSYTTTYTINSANTFEFKTITIPGDTTGTWDTTNGMGLSPLWMLGGGSNRQAPAIGAWGVGQAGGNTITDAPGCVDFIATSGATFYLTGIQLEKGLTATPFDRRDYGRELQMCQRYYYRWKNDNASAAVYPFILQVYNSSSLFGKLFEFPVTMRAVPSAVVIGTFYPHTAGGNSAGALTNLGSLNMTTSSITTGSWSGASGLTAGHASGIGVSVGSYIEVSAEL